MEGHDFPTGQPWYPMAPSGNKRKQANLPRPLLLLATDRRETRQRVRDHGLLQQQACALVTWIVRTELPGDLSLMAVGYKQQVRALTIPCTREIPVVRVAPYVCGNVCGWSCV